MSGAQHTPGPWSLIEGHGFLDVVAGNVHIASCAHRVSARGAENQAVRDARLCAASPELLRYVRLAAHLIGRLDALGVHSIDDGEGEVWSPVEVAEQMDALVAKATGGAA